MNRFWTRLEAKDGTASAPRDPARHYQWAWTGSLFGLLTALVVAVPVIVAVLLLTEFSLLVSDDAVPAVAEPSASDAAGPAPLSDEPTLFTGGGFEALVAPADIVQADTAAPETSQRYTVVAGDTLSIIARRFDTSVDALVAFNDIANRDALRVGQQIGIPPADYVPPPPALADGLPPDPALTAADPIDETGVATPVEPQ